MAALKWRPIMDQTTVTAFEAEIRKTIPTYSVAFKDSSTFMKILGWFSKPFNPGFMTSYITTFGTTVYFPSKSDYESSPIRTFTLLAHEFTHMYDEKAHPLSYQLGYAFPQLLAVPALLGVIVGCFVWGAWALLGLLLVAVCLVPWPAPWRVEAEGRGYGMTMAVAYWMNGNVSDAEVSSIAQQFYGPSYFFMSWSQAKTRALLADYKAQLADHSLEAVGPYKIVHDFMGANGMLPLA